VKSVVQYASRDARTVGAWRQKIDHAAKDKGGYDQHECDDMNEQKQQPTAACWIRAVGHVHRAPFSRKK
jgi:hypothetical protein